MKKILIKRIQTTLTIQTEWLRRERKTEQANSTYPADWHLIRGQGTSLVRTNNWGAPQGFYGGKTSNNSILLGHSAGSKSQAGGNDSRQTLGNSSNSKSNGNFKVIDSTSNPGATMNRIIKVTNVYYPNSDADKWDDFRQLLSKLIQLLLERGSLLFSSHHLITNFANFSVYSCCNNHSHSFTSSNVSTLMYTKGRENKLHSNCKQFPLIKKTKNNTHLYKARLENMFELGYGKGRREEEWHSPNICKRIFQHRIIYIYNLGLIRTYTGLL